MKKYLQSRWMRVLACFLCVVTISACIVSGIGIIFFESRGSKEEYYRFGRDKIAENYAIYALYCISEGYMDDFEEYINGSNFYCEISKGKDNIVYSNATGNEKWVFDGHYPLTTFSYDFDLYSISRALQCFAYGNDADVLRTDITGYVLDTSQGIFYYKTEAGYFRAAEVYVASGDKACTYTLTEVDGKERYYNDYYEETLDIAKYADWGFIVLGEDTISFDEETDNGTELIIINSPSAIFEDVRYDLFKVDGSQILYSTGYEVVELGYYNIKIAVNETLARDDLFAKWELFVEEIYAYEDIVADVFLTCFLIAIVGIVLLFFSTSDDKTEIGFLHKVPIGILTFLVWVVEIALYIFFQNVVINVLLDEGRGSVEMGLSVAQGNIMVMVLVGVLYLQSLITRIKTKTFWRYSEFYYVLKPIKKLYALAQNNLSLFTKGIVILMAITLAEALILSASMTYGRRMFATFIAIKLVECVVVIYVLFQMKQLQDGGARVASGDLSQPIETDKLVWEFKTHGETINKVSDGIALAVEDRIKSERLKTELITNVSHDIKTPLTSIINYVDLIKKEDTKNEKVSEYVEVLDRQSSRLKKLIDDLMEASKASTGNLAVNFEECNADVLLTQVIGEFEEKLKANGLEVVVEKPETPVLIEGDGRHMWRVLDNLLNNACKYSLPNTRVYITLKQEGETATIVFKNISKTALNIPSDELMERFVRGDSSRNTEGSGLGLSIAQSLTELMNGTMKLKIDGDLFKVILTFKALTK